MSLGRTRQDSQQEDRNSSTIDVETVIIDGATTDNEMDTSLSIDKEDDNHNQIKTAEKKASQSQS